MSTATPNILIIEDEPDVRIYLLNLLHSHGYQAAAVACIEDGLARIRSRPPSLVVLDAMLPGDDAQQIYLKLRSGEISGHIPVVLLSPFNRRALRGSHFYSVGAAHKRLGEPEVFLAKPPEAEDFLAAVQQLTGNANLVDKNAEKKEAP